MSKVKGTSSIGRKFVIGARDDVHDPTVVGGTYLINDLYVNALFNFGADKSYITPEFRKLLNHPCSKLRETYIVEMANG